MASTEATWKLVLAAAQRLGAAERAVDRDALIREVQQMAPERGAGSIGPVIQGMTANAPGGQPSPGGTPLWRVERGRYRLAGTETAAPEHLGAPMDPPARVLASPGAEVVLVGCVKSKLDRAAAARDLYTSPLFARRRRYAEQARRPWFILSSRWGLVEPGEVIAPYDLYLGDRSRAYQQAWGQFVVAQLVAATGSLAGLTVEIHAGSTYRAALDAPLRQMGAQPVNPVEPGGIGETIAWYDRIAAGAPATDPSPIRHPRQGSHPNITVRGDRQLQRPTDDPPAVPSGPDQAEQLIAVLTDPRRRLTPSALLATPPATLARPGLYSWWVDEPGATHLSHGAGVTIAAGLIYAGLAGATRWPSGKPSTNTLWSRLAGMHLGGRAEFSTFRRTLAALLREPLDLTTEDDPRLTEWMAEHLCVIPVVVSDPDILGTLESTILERIDPPLNLRGMPTTPFRAKIGALRATRADRVAPSTLASDPR